MGKLLFRIGQEYQHRMRFGETADLYRACYFKGKSLGYKDGDIYFEWPYKIAFNKDYRKGKFFKCPSHSILPIKFVNHSTIDLNDFDEVLDLMNNDVFYKGSPPIYVGKTKETQHKLYIGYLSYLNKYYLDTGEHPVFDIPKDKLGKPYILFHVRIADWSTYRNPDLKRYRKIIQIIQNKYRGKYEFWKCGEPCRGLDNMFDYVAPYYEELDDFLKLINNSSFGVASNSGPDVFFWAFNIPTLEVESPRKGKGGVGYHMPGFWKQKGGTIGEEILDWMDKSKLKVLFKDDSIIAEDIINFTDKWL